METNKILSADVLDIIFDGKNKMYGAYQLRRAYKKTMAKALAVTGCTLLLAFGGTVLANMMSGNVKLVKPDIDDVRTIEIAHENIAPPPPPPPPQKKVEDFKQAKFNPPVIVDDNKVKPDEILKDIEEDDAISNTTVITDKTIKIIQPPVDVPDTKVVEIVKPDKENQIHVKVEIDAAFPGGEGAWRDYLRKTLNANAPVDNGAGGGRYTAIVKFVVSLDGSVSDVKCENDPGFGMGDEAVRVIKKTKNWVPALQNGHYVNAYRTQPIVFVVEEQ